MIPAGDDGWVTRPGTAISDFASPCNPIAAGFFGAGSPPFTGTIVYEGRPLSTSPAGVLSDTDTIVRRTVDTIPLDVQGVGPNSSDIVPLEVVALHLHSASPISVPGFGTWDVEAFLSATTPQMIGAILIDRECPDGGSFITQIEITARLVFTPTGGGPSVVLDPAPLITLNSHCSWALPFGPGGFDPASLAILPLAPGIGLDRDGNGSFESTTIGESSTYRPGVVGCGTLAFQLAPCLEFSTCHEREVTPPLVPPANDD